MGHFTQTRNIIAFVLFLGKSYKQVYNQDVLLEKINSFAFKLRYEHKFYASLTWISKTK